MILLYCVRWCGGDFWRFWRRCVESCLLSCSQRCCHRGVAAGRQVCLHTPWHDVHGVAAGAADVRGGGWRIREEAAAEAEGVGRRQQGVLSAVCACDDRMKKSISITLLPAAAACCLMPISLCPRRRVGLWCSIKPLSSCTSFENIAVGKPTFISNKGISLCSLAQTCSKDFTASPKASRSPSLTSNVREWSRTVLHTHTRHLGSHVVLVHRKLTTAAVLCLVP